MQYPQIFPADLLLSCRQHCFSVSLFLNIILLLAMIKKQKQICNKGDVLAAGGCRCFRWWQRKNIHESSASDYIHQLSSVGRWRNILIPSSLWALGRTPLSFFLYFIILDAASLCLQAQKIPKFSLIILSILCLDDTCHGGQQTYCRLRHRTPTWL